MKTADLKKVVAKLIPITTLKTMRYGSNFCPFHLNTHTPASSLHLDPDGVERLYCYVCNKQYTSYDYLEKILGIKNIYKYLQDRYSDEEIEKTLQWVKQQNKSKTSDVPNIENCKDTTEFLSEVYDL